MNNRLNVKLDSCYSTTMLKSVHISIIGVAASDQMASTDLSRMNNYQTLIEEAGCDLDMDPAIIAGDSRF